MHSSTAAGGLLRAGKTSTATKITFNQSPLRLYSAEETNSKKSPTPYVSYDSSFFQESNLPAAPSCWRVIETKFRQIGRSIPAVFKIVSAPARLWELGAHCFVVRLCVLEWLNDTAAFFGGSMIRDSKTFRRVVRAKLFTPYVQWSIRWLFEARPALNMPCQNKSHAGEGGSRLQEG